MSRLRSVRTFFALVAAAVATLALLLAPSAPAGASTVLPGATTAHPFSDPVWWPLRTEAHMDCYYGNPGCRNPIYHTNWVLDVVSADRTTRRAHEPVYAMGAGILHYGVHADIGCGHSQSRGNWLWIDHGNGVISWYGHLAWPFSVPDGSYVTPRTQIALIGNSGYSRCRIYPMLHYIDIVVKRNNSTGALNGNFSEMRQLYACVNGVRKSWPAQLSGRWQRWNDVPYSNKTPHVIPASDRNHDCIPAHPATPNQATGVRLQRSGTDALTASWTLPRTGPAPTSIVVLIQEYHPSIHRWLDLRKHLLPGNRTATAFTALHHKHQFRVRINFHNGVGYSANTAWVSALAH